jgi:hypothetical protein
MAETTSNTDTAAAASQAADAVTGADTKRTTELASAKTMETIKYNALVKEVARLTAKYGHADMRVKTMNVRIGYSPSIQGAFDKEVARLSIPATAVPPDGWLVEGMVYSADGKPMPGVTVFIIEAGKAAGQGLPFSCTPDTGAYSIVITSGQVDLLKGKTDLYLAVSDANKKILYTDSEPLSGHIQKGTIYNRNIFMRAGNCAAPPAGKDQKADNSGG